MLHCWMNKEGLVSNQRRYLHKLHFSSHLVPFNAGWKPEIHIETELENILA